MSGPVPPPPDVPGVVTPEPKPTVEISPFIAWMSKHGHWILFALFASEVLFEGWAIRSAKRREEALRNERMTPPPVSAAPWDHAPLLPTPSRAYPMTMPARVPDRDWTAERALALPDDGNRYEVLSPGTARADRYRKRAIYRDEGVPEYWIVDAGARMVERWRPGDAEPEVLLDELAWRPREELAPFVLPLGALFDEALA